MRASTSVFVRYWQSHSGDNYIRLLSASAYTIVFGFGDCMWDGYPGGTVSGWSFLQSLPQTLFLYLLPCIFCSPSKKDQRINTLVVLLEIPLVCELYLGHSELPN